MTYQVSLEVFAGPLDLLLHLIERAEIDIYDIPIAVITEQFLAYLRAMELMNLEIAGEFLVMAATLMQIKAKMLLPKPVSLPEAKGEEEGEDPRRELVERLIEYKQVKEAAALLRRREQDQSLLYPRMGGEFADQTLAPAADPLQGLTIWDLVDAFQKVLAAAAPDEAEVLVPSQEISVKQTIAELTEMLCAAGGAMEFIAVFAGRKSRRGLITCFVALLELIRMGRVMAFQDGVFGRIFLRLRAAAGEVPG